MNEDRLPDFRRRRHSSTSTSSDPELLTGDLVVQPWYRFPLTVDDQTTYAAWRWKTVCFYGLIVMAMIAIWGSGRDTGQSALSVHVGKEDSLEPQAK
jgi:hypothetical protein